MNTWFSVWDYSTDEPILLYRGDSLRQAIHTAQKFGERVYHCVLGSDSKIWAEVVWPGCEKNAEGGEKVAM